MDSLMTVALATSLFTSFRCSSKNGPVAQRTADNLGVLFNGKFGVGFPASQLKDLGLSVTSVEDRVFLRLSSGARLLLGTMEQVPPSCSADGDEVSVDIRPASGLKLASLASPDAASCDPFAGSPRLRKVTIEARLSDAAGSASLTYSPTERKFYRSLRDCQTAPVSQCFTEDRPVEDDCF